MNSPSQEPSPQHSSRSTSGDGKPEKSGLSKLSASAPASANLGSSDFASPDLARQERRPPSTASFSSGRSNSSSARLEEQGRDALSKAIRADDLDSFIATGSQHTRLFNLALGNQFAPIQEAFSEGACRIVAWMLREKFSWPATTEPEMDAFCAVVEREGLGIAVARAMLISREVGQDFRAHSAFPFIDQLDQDTCSLIHKYDAARQQLLHRLKMTHNPEEHDPISQLLVFCDGLLCSTNPLQRLSEIVWAFETVAEVNGYRTEQSVKQLPLLVQKSILTGDAELALAVARCIDHLVYNPSKRRADHGSQPDLMLLLNHPQVVGSDEFVSVITEALTAPAAFQLSGVGHLPRSVVDRVFARIGRYTHGGLRFKFDTRWLGKDLPPLLCEFGFRQRERPAAVERFGTSFFLSAADITKRWSLSPAHERIFSQIDPATQFILRRGAWAIRHPELGETWIQNSSLVFGRGCLGAAAVYSPNRFNPRADVPPKDALSVFEVEMYRPAGRRMLENMVRLLDQFDRLLDLYRMWKFDTNRDTAFKQLESGRLVAQGLHRSPGFRHLVDRLGAWWDIRCKNQPSSINTEPSNDLPQIGFMECPKGIPFRLYETKLEDTSIRSLPLTAESVWVLQELADGALSQKDLLETDMGRHLFQSGVEREGELILV